MPFCFIHAADIHLDSPLRSLERYEGAPVDVFREATRRALDNLVALAIDEDARFVLIAGDLYDGDWPDHSTGLAFVARMARLREAGIRVFVVAGNHDAASRITRGLRTPDNVHFFPTDRAATVEMEELGVAVHGRGFSEPEVTEDLSAEYPAPVPGCFNIGLLHTACTGREGHAPYAPCTVEGLAARGYDYWALGHVHTRETLRESPWIVFPGNTQGRHARETGERGCCLVEVDDKGAATVDFRALDVVRWDTCTVDLTGETSESEALESLRDGLADTAAKAGGRPLAVRVIFQGATSLHGPLNAKPGHWRQQVLAAALDTGGGDEVWIEKVLLETLPPQRRDAAPALAEGPVREVLGLIEEARTDPVLAEALAGHLEPLLRALPREVQEGESLAGASAAELAVAGLERAESVLRSRFARPRGEDES